VEQLKNGNNGMNYTEHAHKADFNPSHNTKSLFKCCTYSNRCFGMLTWNFRCKLQVCKHVTMDYFSKKELMCEPQ